MRTKESVDCDLWDAAGPLSLLRMDDVEKEWVVIKSNGECNRDVNVPPEIATIMQERLGDWLNFEIADYQAFELCKFFGDRCAPGFSWDESLDPPHCPFSSIRDEVTGKYGCCHTVVSNGVGFETVLDIVRDHLDGIGPAPRRVQKFRDYVRAMLNFYRLQKKKVWEGEIRNEEI